MKPVAVVILNWNGEKFLKQFLPGVVENSSAVADVYIIDNASSDESKNYVQKTFPQVGFIELDKNHGFAGGYNRGLISVPNEYYLLLNSDVEVTPQWIEPMLQYMHSHPGMVACQPMIMDLQRPTWFEYAGAAGGYVDKDGFAFCAGRIFYEFEEDKDQFSKNEEVFWASGAALLISKKAWEEVNGFDEDFFAHMEEIDLCWRLKNRGYRIGACREARVYHLGGGTLDRLSPFKTYLNFRNNLYLLLKNYRGGNILLKLCRRMFLDGIAGVRFITEGKWSYFTAVLKAHYSFYKNLRQTLRKRKSEEPFSREPNLKGMYTGSIVKHFFIRHKRFIKDLKEELFL